MKNTEPVALGAGVIGVVQALLVTLVAFDIPLTELQVAAVMGLVTSIVAGVQAWLVRMQVTPVATAEAAVKEARQQVVDRRPKRTR